MLVLTKCADQIFDWIFARDGLIKIPTEEKLGLQATIYFRTNLVIIPAVLSKKNARYKQCLLETQFLLNSAVDNANKAANLVRILFGRFNTQEDLLDADAQAPVIRKSTD